MNEFSQNVVALSHAHQLRGEMIEMGVSPENVIVVNLHGRQEELVSLAGMIEILKLQETPRTRELWQMFKWARARLRKAGAPKSSLNEEALKLC